MVHIKKLQNEKLPLKNPIDRFTELQENLNNFFIKSFGRLGELVARYSWFYIIIPALLASAAASGLINAVPADDIEIDLPSTGKWASEKKVIDKHFYFETASNFDAIRTTNLGNYANIIIVAKDGGNILREEVWSAVVDIDNTIKNIDFISNRSKISYNDICAGWKGMCLYPMLPIRPDYLTILSKFVESISQHIKLGNLKFDKIGPFLQLSLGLMLGKPKYDVDGILTYAEAISFYYWLRSDSKQDRDRAAEWEKRVTNYLETTNFPEVNALVFASRSLKDELAIANEEMKPFLALSGVFMVVFAAASSAMTDWVRSKIILSILGIVSVILATGAAFGLLIYCNVPFITMNYVTVFLMLGIGIDDMFVFLAAWRMTSLEDSVETRLAETYKHSGLSITVTSLTNGVSFIIGSFTSVKTVHIFSIYSGVSCLFAYICFLTFFGGCLAVFGNIERRQRHSIFCCLQVQPKSTSENKNIIIKTFCTGGINHLDPNNPIDNKSHLGMVLMRDYVGGLLNSTYGKAAVCVLYVCYAILLSFGLSNLKFEDVPSRVFFRNLTKNYYEAYDHYFTKIPSFAQVVLTKELDYSSDATREKILKLHEALENLPFVKPKLTISWMRDWFLTLSKNLSLAESIHDESSFIRKLNEFTQTRKRIWPCSIASKALENLRMKNSLSLSETEIRNIFSLLKESFCHGNNSLLHFLQEQEEGRHFSQYLQLIFWVVHQIERGSSFYESDIAYNANMTHIQSSRFIIVVENGSSTVVQKSLRKVVSGCNLPGAAIFNFQAIISDQVELVKKSTLFATSSTAVIVLIISLIFIPNLFCSLWIAFCIVSIELGVIGFMVFWGVELDAVAMVNLIMCVGFSVDFSAHMAYAFLNSAGCSSEERICESLYSVGYPIFLGGMSTVVGVLPLSFTNFDTFITFFKIIFLVIVLGMIHGLFFLPVFMSFMGIKHLKHKDLKSQDSFLHLSLKEMNHTVDIPQSTTAKFIYEISKFTDVVEINTTKDLNSRYPQRKTIQND